MMQHNECLAVIKHSTELQKSILRQALQQLSSLSCPPPPPPASGGKKANCDSPPAPPAVPLGMPQLPHGLSVPEPWADAQPSSPPLVELPLHLIMDTFEVMNISPVLGASIALHGGTSAELGFRAEVPVFMEETVSLFLQPQHQSPLSPWATEELSGWHPSFLDLVLRRQVVWSVHVLFLRVPHFFAMVSQLPSSASVGDVDDGGDSLRLSSILPGSLYDSLYDEGCRGAKRGAATSKPCLSLHYPSDAFIEAATCVTVMGVVHEVYYKDRASRDAEPWMAILACTPPTLPDSAADTAGAGSRWSSRPLTVDLHLIAAETVQAFLVIGQVVEIQGNLQVGSCRVLEERGLVKQGGTKMTEYLVAHSVTTPLLFGCALPSRQPRGEMGGGSPLPTTCPHAPTSDADIPPEYLTDQCLSTDEEEWAAQFSVRCWEGLRLCLGTQTASPPCVDGELVCSDFFHMSLDGVVAQLMVVFSSQLTVEDGLSLVLVGEDALAPSAYDRLESAAPFSSVRFHPCVSAHVQRSFFLPSYEVRRGRDAAPSRGTRGRHANPREQCVPPSVFAEVIRGGALTHASWRTVVLQSIEELPHETLKLLQDFFLSGPGCSGVGATTDGPALRVVLREGGQRVPYLAAHSTVCSIRSPAALRPHSPAWGFAQRADMVVAPALDLPRKLLTLWGSTEEHLQRLLSRRGGEWLALLGDSLCPARLPGGSAPHRSPWPHSTPLLTEECGNILRTFFVAARALCPDVVHAGMMKTLAKLACSHALLRCRLEHACVRRRQGDAPPQAGPCITALVDAVVSVGLVDATLRLTTGKTLLGECVFSMMERECLPEAVVLERRGNDTAAAAAATDALSFADSHSYSCLDDEEQRLRAFVTDLEWRTRVVLRGDPSVSAGHHHEFSVIDVVGELIDHLNGGLSSVSHNC